VSRAEDIMLLSDDGADSPLVVACAVAGALLDEQRRAGRLRVENDRITVADRVAALVGEGPAPVHDVRDRLVAKGAIVATDQDFLCGFRRRSHAIADGARPGDSGAAARFLAIVAGGHGCGETDAIGRGAAAACAAITTAAEGKAGDRPARVGWEWRAFWSGDDPVFAPRGAAREFAPGAFESSPVRDRYLLIAGRQDNLKLREGGLEIKWLIESHAGFEAFRRKKTHDFPVRAGKVGELFPRLAWRDNPVASARELENALDRAGYAVRWIDVDKTRYRMKLGPKERIEFSVVTVDGRQFRSLCVEGPSYQRVLCRVLELAPVGGAVMGYAEFLRQGTPAP
jgi:hypothetical protein